MERDDFGKNTYKPRKYFNSHAHVERDLVITISDSGWQWFQLTRSRGAWPGWYVHNLCTHHFNSHAHVERDTVILSLCTIFTISTHTLTWSVTALAVYGLYRNINFNSHAHVERDAKNSEGLTNMKNFNSHAHVERDSWFFQQYVLLPWISTHTLTWSVTQR